MKRKPLLKILNKGIGVLLFLLTACQENIIYHSYQPINPIGWYQNDTLTYILDSYISVENQYNCQIGIRHKDSYLYQDIWLGIIPFFKDSVSAVKTDTVHIYLSDSIGLWKGKGIGELRQFVQPIGTSLPLSSKDTLIGFQIIHLMKDYPLTGIQDIGLYIQNNTNEEFWKHLFEERQTEG